MAQRGIVPSRQPPRLLRERAVCRLLVVVQHVEMAAHGVDVATRHRAGERGFGSEGLDVLERARTSGSNAAAGTPAASASRAACPSSATRWLDATVAAAWYATRSASFTRNGRMPSETASRSTSSGPSTAHHEPGSRATPISADGNDCNGWSDPTSTSGRATAQLVQLVQRAHAGAVDHQRAGARGSARPRTRHRRWRRRGWRSARGRRPAPATAERRVRGRRAAPRRGAPRATRARARPPRPASSHGRPSRAPAWSRRGRAPRGRTPAACDRATE